jgi:hypothetical protein
MKKILFLTLIALLGCLGAARANELSTLKYMLQSREREPRMYLPDMAMLGSDINVLVIAPGAKKIILYGSKEGGETELNGEKLRLGKDLQILGQDSVIDKQSGRANFKVPLDLVKDLELANKFYAFEALITYDNPQTGEEITRRASFFGANASFSNNNAVKVLPLPKDHANTANMARSMIPGLGPNAVNY